jgi:hypothetical protein
VVFLDNAFALIEGHPHAATGRYASQSLVAIVDPESEATTDPA